MKPDKDMPEGASVEEVFEGPHPKPSEMKYRLHPKHKRCFMDEERWCDSRCMAYVGAPHSTCRFIMMAERLTSAATSMLKATTKIE